MGRPRIHPEIKPESTVDIGQPETNPDHVTLAGDSIAKDKKEIEKPGRQEEIKALLSDYAGRIEAKFDEFGSVTFRCGDRSESVHTSNPDYVIKASAKRVSER